MASLKQVIGTTFDSVVVTAGTFSSLLNVANDGVNMLSVSVHDAAQRQKESLDAERVVFSDELWNSTDKRMADMELDMRQYEARSDEHAEALINARKRTAELRAKYAPKA